MRCAKCGRFVSVSDMCVACYPDGACEVKVDIDDFSGGGYYCDFVDRPAPLCRRILRGIKGIICWRGED